MPPVKQDQAKLPDTEPYRVCIAGAVYLKYREAVNADGDDVVIPTRELAVFGEQIDLTDREARRLTGLDAVKPKDEPLSYDEMDEKQLAKLAKDRSVTVRSSGADADRPLRTDYVNALNTFDQGQGKAL
jgi:hypothetical protein